MAKSAARSRASALRILGTVVLLVGILYFGKPVILPLALAILLTFVLTPIVVGIQRTGLPRVPAVLVTVVATLLIFALVGWVVGLQVQKLVAELPAHRDEIKAKLAGLQASGEGPLSQLFQMTKDIEKTPEAAEAEQKPVIVTQPEPPSALERALALAGPVLEPLATAGLVLVLVVFMLIQREELRNRLIGLLGHGRLTGTTQVLVDAADRLSKFLLNQLFVNIGFGVLFGMGLFFIGVPFAFLWGFLAVLLRFVPYVGSWVAVAMPLLLSFAIFPGWLQLVLVLGLFFGLEMVAANVAEPLLFGHSTGVAPIALLVAAAFWAWVWGPIGLILSTPMTVCLVVLGHHIPRLRFLSVLLGDQPALTPDASYYQRLLARDRTEAAALAKEYVAAHGPDKVYDDVFLPALLRMRRDRKHGGLTPDVEEFILQTTQEIAGELVAPAPATPTPDAPPTPAAPASGAEPRVAVIGCPAHHPAEELALQFLAQLLHPEGCRVDALTTRALPSEIEARIAREKPDLVFVAVIPPGGLAQARYLCKRLAQRCPDVRIIVGYFGRAADFDRLLVRLRAAGASYVTTSLVQTRSQVRGLLGAAAPAAAAVPAAGP